jgi:hypothetical protein
MIALLFTILWFAEPDGYFHNPEKVVNGIIVTDNHCSAIYFIRDKDIGQLVSAPGCGRYYAVSADRKNIGFKLINKDGLQIPAMFDAISGNIIKFHKGVEQCGQVSFSNDNKIAFTVDDDFIVRDDLKIDTFNLDMYANCAPISPDGEYVVYNDNHDQLWILNLLTRAKTRFTDDKAYGYYNPGWSPDSRYIVYSRLDAKIKVYDRLEKKTYDIGGGRNPDWSKDAQCLIYYIPVIDDHRMVGSDLYLSKYDGSKKINLTHTPDIFEMDPKFAGDNSIIYHTYEQREICEAKLIDNELEKSKTIYKSKEPLPINYYEIKAKSNNRDSIDVPYLHQVYDTPDWFDGHWACAPTTAMMAIAYYRKLPHWDCWCSSPYGHTSYFGRYICERYRYREVYYNWQAQDPVGTWAWGGYGYMWSGTNRPYTHMAPYINNHGMNSWRDDSPTYNETIAELDAGYPYGMCVALTASGHLVLAVGRVLNQHTLIFNDPYGNKNTPGYPSYDGKYARYDWPGYNHGYENLTTVYWCVGARGDWEPATDTIVDDLQFEDGFYLHTEVPSSMIYWRDALTGFRGHMWWTYSTVSEDTCYATWTPNLTQSGDYEVYAYIPGSYANATEARYEIYYQGGNQTVIINQANFSDEWVPLGTYPFDISGGYVYLGDATGTQGQDIGFDAMRWSYQGLTSPRLRVR